MFINYSRLSVLDPDWRPMDVRFYPSREEAQYLADAVPGSKWVYVPASNHRRGINAMFNHGPEWRLIGILGLVLCRTPAEFHNA